MKLLIVILSSLAIQAQAATLKCWNTYSPSGAPPTIVAKIVSDEELTSFEVNTRQEDFTSNLRTPAGSERGTIITSNRSPYKDMREFDLAGSRLILPPTLDAAALLRISEENEGAARGENGVVIGTLLGGGDGAGSHFSVRLRCRNYRN